MDAQPLEPEQFLENKENPENPQTVHEIAESDPWPEFAALTDREKVFVSAYIDMGCGNVTRAAQAAGFGGKLATQVSQGSRLLRRPKVRAAIDAALNSMGLSKAETLAMLADIARNSRPGAVMRKTAAGRYVFDLSYAVEQGVDHYIKEVEVSKAGRLKFKLRDADAALQTFLKLHGLIVNKSVKLNVTRKDLEGMSPDELRAIADGRPIDGR